VLPADTYLIADAASVTLRLDREDEASELSLPQGIGLKLRQQEVVTQTLVDAKGESHTVPAWVKVRFEYSRAIGLRDVDGSLRDRLGRPHPGAFISAWLRIEHQPLSGGGFTSIPEPISGLGESVISYMRPVGQAFMSLIKMVIVPLVFSSLLVGVASLGDIRKLGRLGGKTLGLYLVTTAIAVTIGLSVAHLLQPGKFVGESDRAALQAQFSGAANSKAATAAEAPSAIDNVLAIIPTNPIESLSSGNMLQIIFFALIFGVALTLLDDKKGTPVVNFFDRVQHAMIVIIHMVMIIAPYGVAALVADVVGQSGVSVLSALLVYALAVFVGLVLHAGLVYGGMVRVMARLPLRKFFRAIRPAQLIAFSTSSSSATLPVTMECAEENLGVSNPVASFVLPLGSTVNMDGTALYQGVAAVFIAQVFAVDLTIGDQLGIVATATMASIGAAGVPGAGMITLAMVLTAAGIPAVGIALILGMDRILDMFRTAVNVTGDLAVTAVMASSEGESLHVLTREEDSTDPNRGFEKRLEKKEHPVPPED
jgi:Na+/H+-dicarboxylate symporter